MRESEKRDYVLRGKGIKAKSEIDSDCERREKPSGGSGVRAREAEPQA